MTCIAMTVYFCCLRVLYLAAEILCLEIKDRCKSCCADDSCDTFGKHIRAVVCERVDPNILPAACIVAPDSYARDKVAEKTNCRANSCADADSNGSFELRVGEKCAAEAECCKCDEVIHKDKYKVCDNAAYISEVSESLKKHLEQTVNQTCSKSPFIAVAVADYNYRNLAERRY